MHISAVFPKTRIDNKKRKKAFEASEQVKGMMGSGKGHDRESLCLEVFCHFFLPQSVVVRTVDVEIENTDLTLLCVKKTDCSCFHEEMGEGERTRMRKEQEGLMERREGEAGGRNL